MNPVDHPHGGGEGKLQRSKPSISLGQSAKVSKLEDQRSDKLILNSEEREINND